MLRVLLITQSFPHFPGEQFLEDEIKYWAEAKDVELTIAPLNACGEPRAVPSTVLVDAGLAGCQRGFKHYIRGLTSPLLLRELGCLLRRGRLSLTTLIEAAKASVRVHQAFAAIMAQGRQYDIIYCYWNDVSAYAAALAKRKGKCDVLVSRAHGFDLYEERRPGGNQPLKRQFVEDFDHVFVISEQARRYFQATFGAEKVSVGRLGVPVGHEVSRASPIDTVRILSVSFCVPVKRIDRIVDGVVEFARIHRDVQVEWMHFGDGPLRESMMAKAAEAVHNISNLQVNFPGELPNREIRKRMAKEAWDVLINASESEGVPVSIMEAMSFGIPAIATNVGGVAELVDAECGLLLGADAGGKEIAAAIGHMMPISKSGEFRSKCKNKVATRFNAERNYRAFVRACSALNG